MVFSLLMLSSFTHLKEDNPEGDILIWGTPENFLFYNSCLYFKHNEDPINVIDMPVIHQDSVNIYYLDSDYTLLYRIGIITNHIELYYAPIARIDQGDPSYDSHSYPFVCCKTTEKINIKINGEVHNSGNNLMADRNFSTGWIVDDMQQKKIEFYFEWSNFCKSFLFVNGYEANDSTQQRYTRIKTMEYYINDELIGVINLKNSTDLQEIQLDFDILYDTYIIRFRILDVYPGKEETLIINEIILMEDIYKIGFN